MDIVDRCKDKLERFRVKELKDILSHVGISKQGKKQDLMDRVLAVLYDEGSPFLYKHINGKEELVAIIDDTHRKMKDERDSEAKKQNSASNNKKQLQEEAGLVKVRCVCGHSGVLDSPIQVCADLNCNIWQHTGCALSSEQDIEKQLCETQFFCQTCRVKRADPFWETVDHLLYPVKLLVSSIQTDSSKPIRNIKKTFELSKDKKDLLVKAEYDVQAWCMLLSDSVPFRIQWPIYAELLVNDVPFRTYNRPGSQPLGANGRDDGVKITLFLVEGVNKISLSGFDDRDFCLGVRLVKKHTLQQVLSMIPLESVGESFEDALARVKRCAGGGVVAENEESDSDIEVVTDSITVSLRCPWQCPVCLKNYSLENVTIDPYFNRILNMSYLYFPLPLVCLEKMRDCKDEISDIELKLDGSWRVKNEVAIKDLSLWHHPDGSLSNASDPSKSVMNGTLLGKHDNNTPGMQKNTVARSVDQPENTSQLYLLNSGVTNYDLEVITMSSSSSEDRRDDAGLSLKKDVVDQTGNLGHKEDEVSSCPPKCGMPQGNGINNSSEQVKIADVIILSDSEEEEEEEEEDVSILHDSSTATTGFDRSGILPPALPESADPQTVLSSTQMSDCSNKTNEDVGINQPLLVSNTTTHTLDAVTGFFQTPDTISGNVNGCETATVDNGHSGNQVVDSSLVPDDVIACSTVSEDFVMSAENNLHGHNDSAAASVSGNMTPVNNPNPTGEGSFREGKSMYDGCNGDKAQVQTTGTNQTESLVYVRSKRRLSLLPNTNGENGSEINVDKKRADGPFSFPRRQRSGRRRQN
ncbi:hypothetical protein V2J09_022984 [Rumex salicifolius]